MATVAMYDVSKKLLKATEQCREDMHDATAHGISAVCDDGTVDNTGTGGEMALWLRNYSFDTLDELNMATVIALARIGAKTYLER